MSATGQSRPECNAIKRTNVLTAFIFLALLTSVAEAQRVVYVLMGQSNMKGMFETFFLAPPCDWTGQVPSNVSYHVVDDGPASAAWPKGQLQLSLDLAAFVPIVQPPVLALGSRLGLAHVGSQVVLVLAAQNGSALPQRNEVNGLGAWVDDLDPLDTTTSGRRMQSVMQQLALQPADELHFIWGQGEADAFPTATITKQE